MKTSLLVVCSLLLLAVVCIEAWPQAINPYVEGPRPLEDLTCTRRNGCKEGEHQKGVEPSIAKRLSVGDKMSIERVSGYPPDAVNTPVDRLLTNIPPPPSFLPPNINQVKNLEDPSVLSQPERTPSAMLR